MALTTSSTLPGPVAIFYEQQFLIRAEENFVWDQLGKQGRIPKGQGKTVVWNRMTQPTAKTTGITEGTDPTPSGISATLLSATLSQYGNYEQVTDIVELTTIDATVKEALDVLAYEAAVTIDTTIKTSLDAAGTVQYASAVANRTSIVASNVVQVADLRKAKRQLNRFMARPHTADRYLAVAHPDVIYDLEGDSNWVNAHIYTTKGIDEVYNGEAGELYGTRWIMTQISTKLLNSGSAGFAGSVYLTHMMGQDFFGVSKLQYLETYVDSPSPRSALRLYSDIGWKASYAVKSLNDSFDVRIESAATA